MEVVFSENALADLDFWKQSGNSIVLKKIRTLLESIQLTPFVGVGKPEALKYNFAGYWSRRITKEHRLVYKIEGNKIIIAQLRFHYA